MVLVWPIRLPGSGELRSVIDADADGVRIELSDDGALLVVAGPEMLRIEHPKIESAELREGESSRRVDLCPEAVRPTVENGALILYRPVGDAELALVAATGWRRFPPRLPDQPIFYPVTNERYAREIAERWNLPEGHGVHVLRFRLPEELGKRWMPVRRVGGLHHTELWVPAAELEAFNEAIVGLIEELT